MDKLNELRQAFLSANEEVQGLAFRLREAEENLAKTKIVVLPPEESWQLMRQAVILLDDLGETYDVFLRWEDRIALRDPSGNPVRFLKGEELELNMATGTVKIPFEGIQKNEDFVILTNPLLR